MPSLNTALQIGRGALRAQQIGLNTVGNNIA
ncbi:MAG: flagellar basal body protein, partial [Candidatus Latescibacterota bacterium]